MPLNIKDPEAHEEAKRLAALTGSTITDAVRAAIREKLDRVEGAAKAKTRKDRVDSLMALARDCADALDIKGETSADHADLYDDTGLPVEGSSRPRS